MRYCPSCGTENPDNRQFCSECRTRLPGATKSAANPRKETAVLRTAPTTKLTPDSTGFGDRKLSTASLVLGIIGLGIPAIITGAIALGQHRPGGRRALTGVILGGIGTIVLLLVLIFGGKGEQPLDRPLIPGHTASWARTVAAHCDRLEAQADRTSRVLGVLGAQEIKPVYVAFDGIRFDIEHLDSFEDQEELHELRDDIIARLQRAEKFLAHW
jgi:hypothetical protein